MVKHVYTSRLGAFIRLYEKDGWTNVVNESNRMIIRNNAIKQPAVPRFLEILTLVFGFKLDYWNKDRKEADRK